MPVIPSPYAIYSHSTTGGNLIRRAMRILGALSTGENPTAAEITDGKEALNQMLDSWNGESLTIPALTRQTFALTGTQTYTIGPGGDFDTAQLVKIDQGDAWFLNNSIETPLEVLGQEAWAGIPLKDVTGWPQYLYYEMLSPLGNINLWPIPDSSFTLVLYAKQLLAQVQSPNETIQLLPGYADALAFNLALKLAPEYGKIASPETIASAVEGKAIIKRQNIKPLDAQMDSALLNGMSGGNFYSGGM